MSQQVTEPSKGMVGFTGVSKQQSVVHHALLARYHGDLNLMFQKTGKTNSCHSGESGNPQASGSPLQTCGDDKHSKSKSSVLVKGIRKRYSKQNHYREIFQSARVRPYQSGIRSPVFIGVLLAVMIPSLVFAQEARVLGTDISGYIKTLNFFTETSGMQPSMIEDPTSPYRDENETVFNSLNRLRLKLRASLKFNDKQRAVAKVDYDHQGNFGDFVDTGDFAIARNHRENRQFIDLSHTLAEGSHGQYEHRLYRASVAFEGENMSLEIGRQQIPWGKGHFFTPTDVFNPFVPTQIELQERDGVDAVNFKANIKDTRLQLIYTPRGRVLHPERWMGRAARDVKDYEIGVLGGFVDQDFTAGFDFGGQLKGSAIRGEFLFRAPDEKEKEFIKFTVNADYNLPGNIHALLEYHFNGQGKGNHRDYEVIRAMRGDIQQLGKNYLALMLGYDVTELLRAEYRTILNMDDISLFMRPELQYELKENLLLTLAAQIFLGDNLDEYGRPKNLYFGELMYNF